MRLSVALCTHNPRPACLARTLAGLRAQSLPLPEWEFLLIDNASTTNDAATADLSWHPAARRLVEPTLGLTSARLRAIAEASGDLLVFVDDDNVLAPDYLTTAARLAHEYPNLGAWSGQCRPEYEIPPRADTAPYLPFLVIRELTSDRWSNYHWQDIPFGAGLCVRHMVAQRYAAHVNADPRRRQLGRIGQSLTSSEDVDLAVTSYEFGLGTGLFRDLVLTHLISAGRVEQSYLSRLAENIAYSQILMNYLRQGPPAPDPHSWRRRLFKAAITYCERLFAGPIQRRLLSDQRRGEQRARREIARLMAENPPAKIPS
ncbi:MAG: glycosyltransferase [Opitutales bacterium]|jgi:glycosyltransferase involved in cell wall biosynthesis